jgi:hypothetical protein
VVAAPFKLIDDFDLDGIFGAGVDTGGFESVSEAAVAHVAFADDAALRVELRHGVRAVPDAVLTADASVRGMKDDAGDGILCICIDGAALDAVCAEAVVAAHGEVEAVGVGPRSPFDLADAAPAKIGWSIVLLVACDLARTAAYALGHVEVETILFARFERTIGYECGFDFYLWRSREELEAVLRHVHDGVRGVCLREFVERKRHVFP